MFPIALNLEKLRVALIGQGEHFVKRQKQLHEAQIGHLDLYENGVVPATEQLAYYHLLLIVDLPDAQMVPLADYARQNGILINVEDRPEYCDFYYSSFVRRGDLLLSVNTNGKSPALGIRIRQYLEKQFPVIWQERVTELGNLRDHWRKTGLSKQQVIANTNQYLDEKGWIHES